MRRNMNLVTNVDIMHCKTICFLNLQPIIYRCWLPSGVEHGVVKPEADPETDASWSCWTNQWWHSRAHHALSLTSMEEQWSGSTNWNHLLDPVVLVSCALVYPTWFRQYPVIHSNRMLYHCTTLQSNHNIWHGSEILNTKNDEIISVAILRLWQHHQGSCAARLTCPACVDGRRHENNYFLQDYIIITSTCRRFE